MVRPRMRDIQLPKGPLPGDAIRQAGAISARQIADVARGPRSRPLQTSQSRSKLLPPGLDPTALYSSRLSARSALYTELHQLLDVEIAALSPTEYRARVVDDNRLAKSSVAARAKTWKEMRSRYRLDAEDPLYAAFWAEWCSCASEAEKGLTAYVFFALNDRLVADLGVEWLYPHLRRAPSDLRLADVVAFIERSFRMHPEAKDWSEETRLAVAQKYLSSVRDFGLARGTSRKISVRPALYGPPVRLLVRALRLAGVGPLEIVQAPAFRLLCIDPTEVIDALGELNRTGAIRFRMQGDVVELDFGAEAR